MCIIRCELVYQLVVLFFFYTKTTYKVAQGVLHYLLFAIWSLLLETVRNLSTAFVHFMTDCSFSICTLVFAGSLFD